MTSGIAPSAAIRPLPQKMKSWLIWLVVLALVAQKTVLVRVRDGSQFAQVDATAAVEVIIVGISIPLAAYYAFIQPLRWSLLWTSCGALLGYYVLCMISSLWSAMPEYSLFRAIEVISQILLVLIAIQMHRTFLDAERMLLWVSGITTLLGVGREAVGNGGSMSLWAWHTNGYTASAAILFSYCAAELMTYDGARRRLLTFFAAFSLGPLLLGTSAASYVAAICGLMVAALFGRFRWVLVPCVLATLMISLAGDGTEVLRGTVLAGRSEQRITSLSGRVELWQTYRKDWEQDPLFGNGFAVSARLNTQRYQTSTHNAIISVALGTGMFGLAVVGIGVFVLFGEASGALRRRRRGTSGCIAAITVGLLNSMTLPIIGEGWIPPSLVLTSFMGLFVVFVAYPNARNLRRDVPAQAAQKLRTSGRLLHAFKRAKT